MASTAYLLCFLLLDVFVVISASRSRPQNPLPSQRHLRKNYHARARLLPSPDGNTGETNSFHNPHLGGVLHPRMTGRHHLRTGLRNNTPNSSTKSRSHTRGGGTRRPTKEQGSSGSRDPYLRPVSDQPRADNVGHHVYRTTPSDLQPTYHREGNTHHLTIPLQRNSRARITIPLQRKRVRPVYTVSARGDLRRNPPAVAQSSKTFRFNIPVARKHHVLATTLPYDTASDNLVTDPAIEEGIIRSPGQKAMFHVRLQQPAPRVSGSSYYPAAQVRPPQRTTPLPTRCVRCPPDQTIVVERGKGCATVVLPPIKTCSGLSRSPGTLEAAVSFGPSPGSAVTEGEYLVQLHILKAGSRVHTCQFRLSVQVRKCSEIVPPPDGLMHCTNGTGWGSTCHFTCLPGFTLVGSASISCEGNKSSVNWTSNPPSCQDSPRHSPLVRSECYRPPDPEYGLVHCEPQTSEGLHPEGAICRYFCQIGYEIPADHLQNGVIVCRNSAWNITENVECLPIRCPKPTAPPNGHMRCEAPTAKDDRGDTPGYSPPNYIKNTVCRYHCKAGYVIPTSQLDGVVIECHAPLWNSSLAPECLPKVSPSHDCRHQTVATDGNTALVIPPRFTTSNGSTLLPSCVHSGFLPVGVYENYCEAKDPELRTTGTCSFTITVVAGQCTLPPDLQNGLITCATEELGTFPAGTVCEYSCQEGYVIPTSQLQLQTRECQEDLMWNVTAIPQCLKRVVPEPDPSSCRDKEFVTSDPSSVVVKIPTFLTASGRPADVTCAVTQVQNHGVHDNLCRAKDPELRTLASCRYSIVVKDVGHTDSVKGQACSPLTAPTHGRIRCRNRRGNFRCNVSCSEGMNFHFSFTTLRKGYVECDPTEGTWDFQRELKLDNLPDCLRQLPTTYVQAPLKFKAGVSNCSDYGTLDRVMTAIKDGLLQRNMARCRHLQCSDFAYMCAEDKQLHKVALETTWTIQGSYRPEISNTVPEVESAIEEVKTHTQNVVTSDRDFKEELKVAGADLWEDSFYQDPFIMGCDKPGFVMDPDTNKCFECPTGTIEEDGDCQKCPGNHYQDQTGQTRCKPCPRRTISAIGSRSRSDCQVADRRVDLILPEPVREQSLTESTLTTPCDSNPCTNGGTCLITRHSFLCLCKDGFRGRRCELPYCPPHLCENGGSCSLYVTGVVGCLCPPEFTGPRCSTRAVHEEVDACNSNPCKHGGQCRSEESKPICKCPPDFTGDHCEFPTCAPPFKEYFCLNGGTCGMLVNSHTMVCVCSPQYMGTRCEYPEGSITNLCSSILHRNCGNN